VATSGLYERGEHLRGVAPGAPVGGLASFSVVGPRLAWADAFATVGFLKGDVGLSWVAQFEGYGSALIRRDGAMVAADSFPLAPGQTSHFALAPVDGFEYIYR